VSTARQIKKLESNVQVQSPAQAAHQQLYLDIAIPVSGYLYSYVANESSVNPNTSVYFDDFSIVHTRSTSALQVMQTTDYYPFGLSMAAQSYQKQTALDNDYLYNGKELQDEHNLGWVDYGARMYMPELGRWGVVDPWAKKFVSWTPFNYAFNNPIRFSDFMGLGPKDEVTFKESRVYSADLSPTKTVVTQMDISKTTITNEDGTITMSTTISLTQNTITKDVETGNTTIEYGKTQSTTTTITKDADGKEVGKSQTATTTSNNSSEGVKQFKTLNSWTQHIANFNAKNDLTFNQDQIKKGGIATAVAMVIGTSIVSGTIWISQTGSPGLLIQGLQPVTSGGAGAIISSGQMYDVVIHSISQSKTRNGETTLLRQAKPPNWRELQWQRKK
jgi:RHS repeat-associated protein